MFSPLECFAVLKSLLQEVCLALAGFARSLLASDHDANVDDMSSA